MTAVTRSLGAKLDPRGFTGMSNKMAALIEYVVRDVPFGVSPKIEEIVVTTDDMVLARNAGDVGMNTIIGNLGELIANFDRLIDVLDLPLEEEAAMRGLLEARIRYPYRQHVPALRERTRAVAARRQELWRNSPERQVERAQRIAEGLCVLEDGRCVTHDEPDTMAHHFRMNPDASTD